MKVTEVGDCSLVVENYHDKSLDNMFSSEAKLSVVLFKISEDLIDHGKFHPCNDYIYTSSTIVLYFEEKPAEIETGDEVGLWIGGYIYL